MIFIVLIFVTWYFCQVCVSRVIVMMESTLPANEWCISTILHCAGLDCYEWCNCNHPIHHHHHPNHHHYHHCPWCNCSWARTSRNLPWHVSLSLPHSCHFHPSAFLSLQSPSPPSLSSSSDDATTFLFSVTRTKQLKPFQSLEIIHCF